MNEKNKKSVMDRIGEMSSYIYLTIMFCVYPGFYTDGLFRIADDKKYFFLFFTAIYTGILIIIIISKIIVQGIKKSRSYWQTENMFSFGLFLSIIFSACFSLNKRESIYGISERRLGALVMLGCVAVFLGIRQYGKFNSMTIWSLLLGSGFIYLCGILTSCKINFLHLQDDLANPEIYPTPIGNTNFNTSYMCLMLPLVMVMFVICRESFSRNIYGIVLYIGFLFSLFLKTESSALCLAAAFFLLAYFALEQKIWFKRYMQLTAICMVSVLTVYFLLSVFPTHLYPFDGLGRYLLSGRMVLLEVVICLSFWGLFIWKRDKLRIGFLRYRNSIRNIAVLAVAAGVIWQLSQITDDSFNTRGYIWLRTIREFKKIPWKNKIFGNGLNCFSEFINPDYRDEMMAMYQSVYIDPHNEFLQVLVTMGIFGAVEYFGLIFVILHKAIRTWRQNELQIVVILTVAIYLMQGMVNSSTIYTLPLLFLFIGLAAGDMMLLQKEE